MARFLAQMIVLGAQTVGRAFTQALRQEFQATQAARKAAEEAGRDGARNVQATTSTGMTLQEAQQILNIKGLDDVDHIRKNYEHLFKMNDKKIGGSFYLQSKVVRAKERLELELDQRIAPDPELDTDNSGNSNSESDSSSRQ